MLGDPDVVEALLARAGHQGVVLTSAIDDGLFALLREPPSTFLARHNDKIAPLFMVGLGLLPQARLRAIATRLLADPAPRSAVALVQGLVDGRAN